MAYASAGAGSNLHDDLSSACTVSSGQCVAPYPYDVDVSSIATRTTNNNPVIRSFGGVRQFLCRTLKQVHFSGVHHESRPFPLERPKRPDKNLQALCRATQLTKEELKKFYRAFKQECPLGTAEPKHFRFILTKYYPLGDCSSYATCLFNAFDPQRKGYLTFEEMVLAISALSRGSLADKLRWVFTLYDSDGDGVIHRSEIRDVILAAYRMGGRNQGNPSIKKLAQHPSLSQQPTSSVQVDQLINQQTDKVFQVVKPLHIKSHLTCSETDELTFRFLIKERKKKEDDNRELLHSCSEPCRDRSALSQRSLPTVSLKTWTFNDHQTFGENKKKEEIIERSEKMAKYLRRSFRRKKEVRFMGSAEHEDGDSPTPRYRPDGIDALCKATGFSRKELQLMYRSFKQECPTGTVNEATFRRIYTHFFPYGDVSPYAHCVFRAFDIRHNGVINFEVSASKSLLSIP
ncbi:putative a-type potassium channel modulatory protein [Daphnia magna]|uniref:Putative a-type potassium channel modulatory protein n=1 Tax=Daphnia magna TaxID=35525 RepID=A0A164W2G5_9CRUS|nr:putative a-type potassium channel modulatory protein [Daphnia magna]